MHKSHKVSLHETSSDSPKGANHGSSSFSLHRLYTPQASGSTDGYCSLPWCWQSRYLVEISRVESRSNHWCWCSHLFTWSYSKSDQIKSVVDSHTALSSVLLCRSWNDNYVKNTEPFEHLMFKSKPFLNNISCHKCDFWYFHFVIFFKWLHWQANDFYSFPPDWGD